MSAPTLTQICGITPEAFDEHLKRPAPDDGGYVGLCREVHDA